MQRIWTAITPKSEPSRIRYNERNLSRIGGRFLYLLGIFFSKQTGRELSHFFIDTSEVSCQHHFFLMLVLETVFLGQGGIVLLLFLDVTHIEVGFTEELGGLELVGLFEVHTVHGSCFCRCKVACCLSADPTCGHICYLGSRNQTVHLLIEGGGYSLIIDADALGGLLDLTEDVILQPFKCFLVSR